jgi:indolepyruvate ferredoxin oxidoreductase beta subunit
MEALRYIEYLKDDGIIIMNKRIMHPTIEVATLSKEKRTDFIQLEPIVENIKAVTKNVSIIDALELAKQAGNPLTENAVFIGALSTVADLPLRPEDMKFGLEKVVPKKAIEQNLKAFNLGHQTAYEGLCQLVECRGPE